MAIRCALVALVAASCDAVTHLDSLSPALLQYRFWKFYEERGPPPLDEAAWLITTPKALDDCPGMRAVTLYFMAEAALYHRPEHEWQALLNNATQTDLHNLDRSNWPVDAARSSFQKTREALASKNWVSTSLDIVICHCRESLIWLRDMPPPPALNTRLVIYEKCGKQIAEDEKLEEVWANIDTVDLPDPPGFRKDECVAFLHYLVHRRESASNYTIFLQADASDHMNLDYLRLVLQMIATTELDVPFLHLNMHRVVKAVTPCKNATYVQIFGREPRNLQSYCCAQFLVRRDRILARDRTFYEKMMNMMDEDTPQDACNDIPGHSTHCLMYAF
eukprot:GEMP01053603.1.p1 GENE.GEMP01053603.1~~GEMP01053603.1.p1  ORF type:complete len:333 (+),score=78.48 GEMP01053603.1:92-1090(+)